MAETLQPLYPPELPPALRPIMEAPYPRFSDAEMQRRRAMLAELMAAADVEHVLLYGINRMGNAVPYFAHWPTTAEAGCVVSPGMRDKIFVQYHNHVALAKKLAIDAEVEWGGDFGIGAALAELEKRGAKRDRVGFIGPLSYRLHAQLAERFGRIADLGAGYMQRRLVKSAEEIDWYRIGALLSDRGLAALAAAIRPGVAERELGAAIEASYVPYGGTNVIHFIGATSMADPDCCVPRQFPSTRRLAQGDVVFAEISAAFWDYSGQVLRSFTVDAEPTPLYRDLHQTADAAFDAIAAVLREGATPADVVAASAAIEQAGFTTDDDVMHGYGGGYLPPIIGSTSRPAGKLPALTFKAGMMVVIQPNVVTKDGKAGVQTGECVLITKTGIERLHNAPRGFLRAG
ncbi:MAG TPA: M24 family metallopeptidase [Stellaceae bacterium]|nr:M24 family metallopeptidase [Stellaceae bacterium]